jgi:hypothetical protein
MLDVEKLTKDIRDIFDKYPYKKRALNLKNLDRDIGCYVRKVHEEVKGLDFTEKCHEMNMVYKIINDFKKSKD